MISKRPLKIALISGPSYEPLYRSLDVFEQSTGIPVEIGFMGTHPELNDHLEEVYEKGDGDYDLISTHTKYVPSQSHYLLSLQDHFTQEELEPFSSSLIQLATIDGELKSIPRNVDVRLLFYRSDWFQELGIDVPRTWEELALSCATLKAAGYIGFAYTGKESGLFGTFLELLTSEGGRLFDDSLQPAFNSAAGRSALAYLKRLYERGYTPGELPDMHYDEVSECFREGRCAMVTDWPGYYSLYADPELSRIRGKFGIALIPAGTTGRAIYGGSHAFAIPSGSRNMEAAIRLLRYLTSPQVQNVDARHGHIPVRTGLLHAQKLLAEAGSLEEYRWTVLEETLARYVVIPPKFPAYPKTEDQLWTSLQHAITGKLTVDKALDQAEESIKRLLIRSPK